MRIWFKTHPFFPLRWAPPTHCWKLARFVENVNQSRITSEIVLAWSKSDLRTNDQNVSLTCLTGYQTSNHQNVWIGSLPSQHLPRLRRLPWGLFSTPPLLILHGPSSPPSPGSTDFKRAKDSVENRVAIITVMEIKTGKCCQRNLQFQELLTRSRMLRVFGVSVPFWTLWGDCRGKVHKESAKNSFVGFVASCWPNVIHLD